MIDSPPAFPFEHGHSPDAENVREPGMSLRDYFACAAMNGFVSAMKTTAGTAEEKMASDFAAVSYKFADAMLVERTKR